MFSKKKKKKKPDVNHMTTREMLALLLKQSNRAFELAERMKAVCQTNDPAEEDEILDECNQLQEELRMWDDM